MSDNDFEQFDEDYEDANSTAELMESDDAQEDSDVLDDDLNVTEDEAAEDVAADAKQLDGEDEGLRGQDGAAVDDVLYDKANKAARLLRARRAALRAEAEERGNTPSLLVRAISLLKLKPRMEQKEMSDLLGCRLRELDAVLAEAEEHDIVARIEPDEPDMRKIVVMAADNATELAEALEKKEERLVPGLSDEDASAFDALLDKIIDPLVALGLDEERPARTGFRGGHDDRRSSDRGSRNGFGDRGRNSGRGSYGSHDHHGSHDRDDRRGGYRGGNDRRSSGGYRGHDDHGGRDGRRGGYQGGASRGGYRGGDHRSSGAYRGGDHRSSGGYRGNSDRRSSGGYRGRDGYDNHRSERS